MIRRTLEIASKAQLRVKLNQLIIRNDEGEHSVPFEDIGFLILDNPQITCSQSVFRHCARGNVALIVTDEKHLPASMLLPLDVHSTQGKIMRMQASTPEQVQHMIWQQIVQAKIGMQAASIKRGTRYKKRPSGATVKNNTARRHGQSRGPSLPHLLQVSFRKRFQA